MIGSVRFRKYGAAQPSPPSLSRLCTRSYHTWKYEIRVCFFAIPAVPNKQHHGTYTLVPTLVPATHQYYVSPPLTVYDRTAGYGFVYVWTDRPQRLRGGSIYRETL